MSLSDSDLYWEQIEKDQDLFICCNLYNNWKTFKVIRACIYKHVLVIIKNLVLEDLQKYC